MLLFCRNNISHKEDNVMPANIDKIIEQIINKKNMENKMLVSIIKAKLLLKGIDFRKMSEQSYTDPLIIARINEVLKQI